MADVDTRGVGCDAGLALLLEVLGMYDLYQTWSKIKMRKRWRLSERSKESTEEKSPGILKCVAAESGGGCQGVVAAQKWHDTSNANTGSRSFSRSLHVSVLSHSCAGDARNTTH